jgi:exopolysaccharide/PEP-CTERM locus tyrosine autokinase
MSLVEQTIARLKRQQAKANAAVDVVDRSPHVEVVDSSPHVDAHDIAVERLEETDNARQIIVDNAALRARGYFPERERDRQFADQYRRIKRPLIDKAHREAATRSESRIIMVTSALPGDGKTFTSINLALSMAAERDVSVLLIDADVAKRHISTMFGVAEQPGLLDALVNEDMDAEAHIVPTTTRGFSILPAGTPMAGTEELLSSHRMRKVMASLCTRSARRVILLDSPPLLVTNEGRALLKIAGQVVLVVRAEVTPRDAIQAAVGLFEPQHAGGVVLNQVISKAAQGYYEYGSYGTDGDQT